MYNAFAEFPAGILQGAFFSNDRPRYMNYGAIGFVIGHEITHGFDDQGRQFDKNGNLVDWWAPQTKEKYLEKAECIIHQYGNYTVEDVNLNVMIDFYYTLSCFRFFLILNCPRSFASTDTNICLIRILILGVSRNVNLFILYITLRKLHRALTMHIMLDIHR